MYEFGDIVILWIQWVKQCVYLKDLYINTLESMERQQDCTTEKDWRAKEKERIT